MPKSKTATQNASRVQDGLASDDPDCTPKQEASTSYAEQHQIKTDESDLQRQEQVVMQQSTEMMVLMQQLLVKQDLLLEENKQIKKDMVIQQITINNLSQAVENLQGNKTVVERILVNEQPSTVIKSQSTTVCNCETEYTLKDKAAKQLQSKRINQLLDSTPFSGTASQEVSDWIEDFNSKCEQVQLDDNQRLSVAIDLLKGNAKLWYELHKDTIDNWKTLKEKLLAYFKLVTGTDQFQLEQKLYNRKRQPNELAIDYCHNVLKLCSKVNRNMDEEIRLKHLIKGLNPAAQLHMDSKSPSTTEEFLESLIKYDKWHEEKPQQRGNAGRGYRRNTSQQEPQQLPQQHQSHQYNHPSQGSNQNHYANNETTYSGCWSCGDMNHYQRDCPKNC